MNIIGYSPTQRKPADREWYPGITTFQKARGRIDRDADRLGLPAAHVDPYPSFGAPALLVADFSDPEGSYFGGELRVRRQTVRRLAEVLSARRWCREAIPSDDGLKLAVRLKPLGRRNRGEVATAEGGAA